MKSGMALNKREFTPECGNVDTYVMLMFLQSILYTKRGLSHDRKKDKNVGNVKCACANSRAAIFDLENVGEYCPLRSFVAHKVGSTNICHLFMVTIVVDIFTKLLNMFCEHAGSGINDCRCCSRVQRW